MTKISRQRKWQLARQEKGICTMCGHEPLVNKTMGEKCRRKTNIKNREKQRERLGSKRRFTKCPSYQET